MNERAALFPVFSRRTSWRRCRFLVGIAALALFVCPFSTLFAQGENTFAEAYNSGVDKINSGNLAAARAPLERALKLAKTDKDKLDTNRALLVVYRELPEIEPMQKAAEYIIANSKQAAAQSLTRRALLEFIHRRGKMDEAVKAYEAKLTKVPRDYTTLYVLTEAYATYKKDPARSAELGERLAAIEKTLGKSQDVLSQAKLAQQYVKSNKLKEGAELYEKIAPLDAKMQAWHYKEAAAAWLKAGDKEKALAAATKSLGGAPESRTDLLKYFWYRGLADIYLDAGSPKEAVPLYEKAIATTTIQGYKTDSEKRLAKAKAEAMK
jgi:tetratricopeptide (TPR) repeat protein